MFDPEQISTSGSCVFFSSRTIHGAQSSKPGRRHAVRSTMRGADQARSEHPSRS